MGKGVSKDQYHQKLQTSTIQSIIYDPERMAEYERCKHEAEDEDPDTGMHFHSSMLFTLNSNYLNYLCSRISKT